MDYKDILHNLYAEIDKFKNYHYQDNKPNAILMNGTVLRTLLCFEEFRQIGKYSKDGFKIMGMKVYETINPNVFIKVMLISEE